MATGERLVLVVFGLVLMLVGSYAIARRPAYGRGVQLLGWVAIGGAASAIGLGIAG